MMNAQTTAYLQFSGIKLAFNCSLLALLECSLTSMFSWNII